MKCLGGGSATHCLPLPGGEKIKRVSPMTLAEGKGPPFAGWCLFICPSRRRPRPESVSLPLSQHFNYTSPHSSPYGYHQLSGQWPVAHLPWVSSGPVQIAEYLVQDFHCIIHGDGSGICSCPRKWGFGISYSLTSFLSTIDLLLLLRLIDNSRLLPLSYPFPLLSSFPASSVSAWFRDETPISPTRHLLL